MVNPPPPPPEPATLVPVEEAITVEPPPPPPPNKKILLSAEFQSTGTVHDVPDSKLKYFCVVSEDNTTPVVLAFLTELSPMYHKYGVVPVAFGVGPAFIFLKSR